MTIFELGALGEFVGAIAVVVTLVYLAMQVRQNKEALEANTSSLNETKKLAMAQTYQTRADSLNDLWSDVALSESLSTIMFKAQTNVHDLTAEEIFRLKMHQLAVVAKFDSVYYQYQQGFLDQEYFETTFKNSARVLGETLRKNNMMPDRPSFRSYIESLLNEVD